MKNLERLENLEGCLYLVGFESEVGNLVVGCCPWHNDIGTLQSPCVAE